MYILKVAAINDAGYGLYSDPLNVITETITSTVKSLPLPTSALDSIEVNTTSTGTSLRSHSEPMTTETPTSKV